MGHAKRPNSVHQIYHNIIDSLNTDQPEFQNKCLAPLGLLIAQFKAKENQYLRYDIKKVIVRHDPPIKVIKFSKQKLCELR